MRTILAIFLFLIFAGCRFVNEDTGEVETGLNGSWRGGTDWIELEIELSENEDQITGSGFITKNPLEGKWSAGDISIDLTQTNNVNIRGTWQAGSNSGTLGGLMTYPLISLRLRRASDSSNVGSMMGRILEDHLTIRSLLIHENDTSRLDLRHEGKLPVVPIEIFGSIRGEDINLQLGSSFTFGGRRSGRVIAGVVEVANVTFYRLYLNRISD